MMGAPDQNSDGMPNATDYGEASATPMINADGIPSDADYGAPPPGVATSANDPKSSPVPNASNVLSTIHDNLGAGWESYIAGSVAAANLAYKNGKPTKIPFLGHLPGISPTFGTIGRAMGPLFVVPLAEKTINEWGAMTGLGSADVQFDANWNDPTVTGAKPFMIGQTASDTAFAVDMGYQTIHTGRDAVNYLRYLRTGESTALQSPTAFAKTMTKVGGVASVTSGVFEIGTGVTTGNAETAGEGTAVTVGAGGGCAVGGAGGAMMGNMAGVIGHTVGGIAPENSALRGALYNAPNGMGQRMIDGELTPYVITGSIVGACVARTGWNMFSEKPKAVPDPVPQATPDPVPDDPTRERLIARDGNARRFDPSLRDSGRMPRSMVDVGHGGNPHAALRPLAQPVAQAPLPTEPLPAARVGAEPPLPRPTSTTPQSMSKIPAATEAAATDAASTGRLGAVAARAVPLVVAGVVVVNTAEDLRKHPQHNALLSAGRETANLAAGLVESTGLPDAVRGDYARGAASAVTLPLIVVNGGAYVDEFRIATSERRGTDTQRQALLTSFPPDKPIHTDHASQTLQDIDQLLRLQHQGAQYVLVQADIRNGHMNILGEGSKPATLEDNKSILTSLALSQVNAQSASAGIITMSMHDALDIKLGDAIAQGTTPDDVLAAYDRAHYDQRWADRFLHQVPDRFHGATPLVKPVDAGLRQIEAMMYDYAKLSDSNPAAAAQKYKEAQAAAIQFRDNGGPAGLGGDSEHAIKLLQDGSYLVPSTEELQQAGFSNLLHLSSDRTRNLGMVNNFLHAYVAVTKNNDLTAIDKNKDHIITAEEMAAAHQSLPTKAQAELAAEIGRLSKSLDAWEAAHPGTDRATASAAIPAQRGR